MLHLNLTCAPTDQPPQQSYKSVVTRGLASGGNVVVEDFPFQWNNSKYTSHLAYQRGKLSLLLVLVFPNYAGEKQFDVDQAIFLARCGYTALSVDMYMEDTYENGVKYPKSSRNHRERSRETIKQHFAGAFTAYNWFQLHPKRWRDFQSKLLRKARTHKAVHPKFAAAIGYCFGGQCCLENKLGM